MMKKILSLTLLVLSITLMSWSMQLFAANVKELVWEDLVPKKLLEANPMGKLSLEEQDTVFWVLYLMENLPKEITSENERLHEELNNSKEALEKKGVNFKDIVAWIDRLNSSVVAELNNTEVSLAGYLLPLEMNKQAITEFLLVPYVGACIHVPPPPMNQIVYVKLESDKGYRNKKPFDPVVVRGIMHSKASTKSLFLVDGTSDIDIGYTMEGLHVEPHMEYQQ